VEVAGGGKSRRMWSAPFASRSDFLAKDREMDSFEAGDLLAVMSAGAYGFSRHRITTPDRALQRLWERGTCITSSGKGKLRGLGAGGENPGVHAQRRRRTGDGRRPIDDR